MKAPPALKVAVVACAAMAVTSACSSNDPSPGASNGGAGSALYAQSCALCHGTDLRGTDLGPSPLSEIYAPDHHSDSSFRAAIVQGTRAHHWDFGDMPPVRGLSEAEIEAIIAYVRAQQEAQGLEPYPPR